MIFPSCVFSCEALYAKFHAHTNIFRACFETVVYCIFKQNAYHISAIAHLRKDALRLRCRHHTSSKRCSVPILSKCNFVYFRGCIGRKNVYCPTEQFWNNDKQWSQWSAKWWYKHLWGNVCAFALTNCASARPKIWFLTPIKSLILFSSDFVLAFPSHFGLSFWYFPCGAFALTNAPPVSSFC